MTYFLPVHRVQKRPCRLVLSHLLHDALQRHVHLGHIHIAVTVSCTFHHILVGPASWRMIEIEKVR